MNDTEGRQQWDTWVEAQRRSFLEYHEFNPRFSHYTWPMLPYSVQQLIMASDGEINLLPTQPTITGACSECGSIRSLTGTYGGGCPECGHDGLAWAYHSSSSDNENETLEYMRSKLSPSPEPSTEDKLDITELNRMWELRDERS